MANATKLLLLSFLTIVRLNIINCHQDYRWANPSGEGGDLREYEFFHRDVSQTNSISSYTTHDQNYWNSPAQSSNLSNLDLSLGLPGQSSAEHTENVNRVDQSSSSSAYVSHPGHAYNHHPDSYPQGYTHNPPVHSDSQHYNYNPGYPYPINYQQGYAIPDHGKSENAQEDTSEDKYFAVIASSNYPFTREKTFDVIEFTKKAIRESGIKLKPTSYDSISWGLMLRRSPTRNTEEQQTQFITRLCSQYMTFLLSLHQSPDQVLQAELTKMLDWFKLRQEPQSGWIHLQEKNQHFILEQKTADEIYSRSLPSDDKEYLELNREFKIREARIILMILQDYLKSENLHKWRMFFKYDDYFLAFYLKFRLKSINKPGNQIMQNHWDWSKVNDLLPWSNGNTNIPEPKAKSLFYFGDEDPQNIKSKLFNLCKQTKNNRNVALNQNKNKKKKEQED